MIRASAIHRGGGDGDFVRWAGLNKNVPNPDEAAHAALDGLETTRDEITTDIIGKSLSRLKKYVKEFGLASLIDGALLVAMAADLRRRHKGRSMTNGELLGWCEEFLFLLDPNIKRPRPPVPAGAGDAKYWDLSLSYCDLHVATFQLDFLDPSSTTGDVRRDKWERVR